jgi:amino-acid N-acetyltransferase
MRTATNTDLPAIQALLERSQLPRQGVEECALMLLEERDGVLLGCIGLEIHDGHGLLRSATIVKEAQGQGLGSSLVRAILGEAVRLELFSVSLLTETAKDYFPKFGFKVVEHSSLPKSLQASAEFRGACPDSATAMMLEFAASNGGLNAKDKP